MPEKAIMSGNFDTSFIRKRYVGALGLMSFIVIVSFFMLYPVWNKHVAADIHSSKVEEWISAAVREG